MKKWTSCFIVVVLLVIIGNLSSCAHSVVLPLKEHALHYQPSENSEKGNIYFYMELSTSEAAGGIYLIVDGNRVGGVNRGTYFVYEATPGRHWIAAENYIDGVERTKRTINVAAGKDYFIRTTINAGHPDPWGDIQHVGADEGNKAIKSLKYATIE